MLATNHGGTSADIDNARAQLILAQRAYDNAKAAYDAFQNVADTDTRKAQAYTNLFNAQKSLTNAQNNLDYFLLVPNGSDVEVARGKISPGTGTIGRCPKRMEPLKKRTGPE